MINYDEDIVSDYGDYNPSGKDLYRKLIDSFDALPALVRAFVDEDVEKEWVEEALKISEWLQYNMMRNAGCIMLDQERQSACNKLYEAQRVIEKQIQDLKEKLRQNEQAIYVVLTSFQKDHEAERRNADV